MPRYTFVNPYNFIPLPSQPARTSNRGNLSGMIEYKLLTKTPLFIPNTSNDHAFGNTVEGHKSYDFFSYQDLDGMTNPAPTRPVIPGSEMRGVLRSNYEIITDSCLSSLDTRAVLSKRTMESFEAGLIRKMATGYQLYEAEDCLWRTLGANNITDELHWQNTDTFRARECYIQDTMPEGAKVAFSRVNRHRGKPLARQVHLYDHTHTGPKTGYLIKGVAGPGSHSGQPGAKVIPTQKHCAHVFLPKANQISRSLDTALLDKTLEEYRRNDSSDYTEYSTQWNNFKDHGTVGEYFPVYYSKISSTLYLSPACKTRDVYSVNLGSLAGSMKPCTKRGELCPACSLFGTLADDGAVSSRIRVLDLEAEDKNNDREYYDHVVTLKPLSSPKLSNTEFYLKRPDHAHFWTYEYYVDSEGEVQRQNGTLAGRKFYWHNLAAACKPSIYKADQPTNQNMTVRPVKPGISFTGRIYFEKLTEKELRDLLFVIQAGDVGPIKTKTHGLKLGAAKPLGFGSAAMEVTGVTLRSYCMEEGTVKVKNDPFKVDLEAAPVCRKDEFLKMTNFEETKGELVVYPREHEGDEGFKWFTNNHARYKDGNIDGKMPNSRKEMIFRRYMTAIELGLADIDIMEINDETDQNPEQDQVQMHVADGEMEATVTRVNKKGTRTIETLSGEGFIKKENILEGQNPQKDDQIKVEYIGKVGSQDFYKQI